MKKSLKKIFSTMWFRAICVGIICTVISVFLGESGILDYLENKSYDRRMNNSAFLYAKPSDEIVFITVDQASLDWAYENKGWSWPWPREAYANIVDFLSAGNVNSIAFDMFYTEPSVYGDEDDLKFAEAQKNSGNVVHTVFVQDSGKVLFPVDPIKNTSALIANVTSTMDKDDVIRRYKPFSKIGGTDYPSLGLSPIILENRINNEDLDFPPMLEDGTVRLRYKKSIDNYLPYSASDILESYDLWKNGEEGFYVPEDFDGTYVFFALYAPGLFDICSTPVSQVYPGVGVHITSLDNYLQKEYIYDAPKILNYLWVFLVSLIASFIVAFGEKRKSQIKIVLFLSIGFLVGGIVSFEIPFLLFCFGIYIYQTLPFVNYLISFLLMFGIIYLMEGKQKRFIKSAFSQCLSKDVVNSILSDPSSFTLGGQKFQMSAIFTDIEKFSSISEVLTASQLGKLLNYYLTRMSDIIINEHGTVDKYEGDAIVAMVGAPVKMEDHAIRACRAALKMKKEEFLMNSQIKALVEKNSVAEANKVGVDEELFEAFKILRNKGKRLYTRIGINSGEMIAGYFGSTLKKNYTIMGNNVNLASRLEGVNKQYSTYGILISEYTKNQLNDEFIVRRLDKVQVVNVNTPIQLYELLEEKQNGSLNMYDSNVSFDSYVKVWEKAMDLFEEEKYIEALKLFTLLSEKNSDDRVAKYYISLLSNFFVKGKYPTEADSIGVAYNPELKVFKLLQK